MSAVGSDLPDSPKMIHNERRLGIGEQTRFADQRRLTVNVKAQASKELSDVVWLISWPRGQRLGGKLTS